MTTTDTVSLQIPLRPKPGEVWLTVNLNLVEDVPSVYELARSLGYKPLLAHRQTREGIEIHLLLHHERRETLEKPLWEEFEAQMYTLSDAINSDAIHLLCGLTKAAAA